ncbi:MAG TPA: hypothetical protein VFP77_09590 [Gemmatimonadaceae bacterium]|nr:hypothetical protein [Gemmatimonadaceae bacterium]
MSTLRERSLSGASIRKTTFTSSHWPDYTVEVRSVTGAKKMEIADACRGNDGEIDTAKLVPAMIVESVYDPSTGEQVYGPADRDALMNESAAALDEIWNDAVAPMNGYGSQTATEKN